MGAAWRPSRFAGSSLRGARANRDADREGADPARSTATCPRWDRGLARRCLLAGAARVSGALIWLLVALGLAVVVVRRRSVAVGLVTAQALVLAVDAVRGG